MFRREKGDDFDIGMLPQEVEQVNALSIDGGVISNEADLPSLKPGKVLPFEDVETGEDFAIT